jgi:hypothetical protein
LTNCGIIIAAVPIPFDTQRDHYARKVGETVKRTQVTEWPAVRVTVNPETMERIEAYADRRAVSVSAVIREALDRVYRPEALVRP